MGTSAEFTSGINEAIVMNQFDSKQQIQYEREYEELIAECHALIVAIAQRPYAIKVLRAARQGLLMHLGYKSKR